MNTSHLLYLVDGYAMAVLENSESRARTVRENIIAALSAPAAGEEPVAYFNGHWTFTPAAFAEARARYPGNELFADMRPAYAAPPSAHISCYTLPASEHRFAKEIQVQRTRRADGTYTWAVRCDGDCLNQQGQWEWEPQPSSRDDAFLARCRFDSASLAIAAAQAAILAMAKEAPDA